MYYIIDKNTRELRRESRTPFNVDETVQPPDPYIQLKRVEDNAQPVFDVATQKLVREFVDDDQAFTRTFRYVVAQMTQAERDAYQRQQQDAATLEQIKAVYTAMKNGTGTNLERLVRLERAVAYLLRQHATEAFK